MKTINKNLDKITDAWNYYFWVYPYCQRQINFKKEAKSNYYGDILSYFRDTLDSIGKLEFENDLRTYIFQLMAVLQIIYVQQDLIDELLYIFKLPSSQLKDKNPNRNIRNELIGHPIRRNAKTKEFISSSFFCHDFPKGTIQYILYCQENDFRAKTQTYEVDKIVQDHSNFLLKYTNKILDRIEQILRRQQTKIIELDNIVNRNIPFPELLRLVKQIYPRIEKEDYLFEKEILLNCYERQEEHPRYRNAVDLYLNTLKVFLPETVKNIDKFLEPPEDTCVGDLEPITISYSVVAAKEKDETDIRDFSYEFSKLFEQHPIYGVDYFKSKFSNDEQVMVELNNMSQNFSDRLEYYSSFEYLRKLLTQRKYLNDYEPHS